MLYISIITMTMASKLGSVVTYNKDLPSIGMSLITWFCKTMWQITYYEGLPCIKSLNPQNTWSHEVTWQIKYISLLTQGLFPLNITRCLLNYYEELLYNLFKHVVFWDHLIDQICFISITKMSKPPKLAEYWSKVQP